MTELYNGLLKSILYVKHRNLKLFKAFLDLEHGIIHAFIYQKRIAGKKVVLQNTLLPMLEEEKYSELLEVRSFFIYLQTIMLNGKDN